MAITGTAASGSITLGTAPSQAATYAGQNIIIPNESAGIGDIVFKSGSTVIVMAGQTYMATPSGYTLMGVIYGWENRMAMVCAPTESSAKWANTTAAGVDIGTIANYPDYTSTAGKPRNCLQSGSGNQTYLVMNIATVKSISNDSRLTSTLLHPKYVMHPSWNTWLDPTYAQMSISRFDNNTSGAKDMYKTYEAYLAQVKPAGRGGGGVFSQKYHKGREYTRILASATSSAGYTFPAAQYCWNYGAGGGTYWLPDMVELLQLMNDDTLKIVNKALLKCGTQISAGADHWSSVRYYTTNAWHYHGSGCSGNISFYNGFTVRPVTLLKL